MEPYGRLGLTGAIGAYSKSTVQLIEYDTVATSKIFYQALAERHQTEYSAIIISARLNQRVRNGCRVMSRPKSCRTWGFRKAVKVH